MWDIFVEYYIGQGLLWTGIGYTLALSAIAVFFGAILGALLAIGKMSRFKALRFIITAFIEIMRGTPALLQLYIAYFIVPMLLTNLNPTPIACVAIGLMLNSAAYVSEIIRSGIDAVDKGQTEAARALGLTARTTMVKVVMPHQGDFSGIQLLCRRTHDHICCHQGRDVQPDPDPHGYRHNIFRDDVHAFQADGNC